MHTEEHSDVMHTVILSHLLNSAKVLPMASQPFVHSFWRFFQNDALLQSYKMAVCSPPLIVIVNVICMFLAKFSERLRKY